MNIFLWILQALLALHTLMGAVWKFANSEQTVPSLSMIPNTAWLGLGVFEIICAIALLVPALNIRFAKLAPAAAICLTAEMILFCILHINSGDQTYGQVIYWLVVAAVCTFTAYMRLSRPALLK